MHVLKPSLSADLSVQPCAFLLTPCMAEPERPLRDRQPSNQLCLPLGACRAVLSDGRPGLVGYLTSCWQRERKTERDREGRRG